MSRFVGLGLEIKERSKQALMAILDITQYKVASCIVDGYCSHADFVHRACSGMLLSTYHQDLSFEGGWQLCWVLLLVQLFACWIIELL